MAKTNFTKAEAALSETLQKISKDYLLEEADAAQGKPKESTDEHFRIETAHSLKRWLKRLHKSDPQIYEKLKVPKKELDKLLTEPEKLSDENWQKVMQVREKIDQFMNQLAANKIPDEQIVEQQRHKHIHKRFNVNERWLPLK